MIITPFISYYLIAINQEKIYTNTYYAALVDKVNLLEKNQNKRKIILIGGSNVAFGFNSELLEKEFEDYKVVNFGLYAALGTKIMIDLSKDYINNGDIVIISPEISAQSMSLYFNPINTLKALEDNLSIINDLPNDNKKEVINSSFEFVRERRQYSEPIVSTGVYQRKNFNDYGDISYDEKDSNDISLRSQNRMGSLHYDPSMLVDFSFELDKEFIDYLNEFKDYIYERKAKIYFSFSPVNELATVQKGEELKEATSSLYWNLKKSLNIEVIGNPMEYVMDAHYFYDSNFHLNDNGSILRTRIFAQDLYRDVFSKYENVTIEEPEMPEYPKVEVIENDSANINYFNYKDNGDSYSIVSLKEEYYDLEEVILPTVKDNKAIIGIEKDAFKGSSLKTIRIPSLNIKTYFANGAFDNCKNLEAIYLEEVNPDNINVSYTGELFGDSISSKLKVYVPNESLTSYRTNYFWGAYATRLEGYDL